MGKYKLKDIMSTSLYFLAVLVITFLVIKYVGQRTEVIGRSMEPTLSDGDNLIVDKFSYLFRDPERFEIIVFPYRDRPNLYYIKRVIGLPGETVYIDTKGKVYVNDEMIMEDYIKDFSPDQGLAAVPITLGEDEYFVLGDNRNNSIDSRFTQVGIVKRDEIMGRALMRVWPITNMKILEHG